MEITKSSSYNVYQGGFESISGFIMGFDEDKKVAIVNAIVQAKAGREKCVTNILKYDTTIAELEAELKNLNKD